MLPAFETRSVRMESFILVTVQAPVEDMDRIAKAVGEITPLQIGHYDQNSFEAAGRVERYRPRDGAVAGTEPEMRLRPNVGTLSFQLPTDQALLEKIIEGIFQVHSYQEPVIIVQQILASRSKGLDDRDNPNRWWNTTGDWKKQAVTA